jgi:hypothetical protein
MLQFQLRVPPRSHDFPFILNRILVGEFVLGTRETGMPARSCKRQKPVKFAIDPSQGTECLWPYIGEQLLRRLC